MELGVHCTAVNVLCLKSGINDKANQKDAEHYGFV